jgi:signal transduction histidine kinase
LNIYLFEWVLENLIKNCIDAIEQDNGQIQITTSLHNDFKKVIIDLMDNGRGIPANLKKDIFKPGFSTKTRGWGLGLSLARRIIVEYHQGKLFLKESRPFEKTVFRIILKI